MKKNLSYILLVLVVIATSVFYILSQSRRDKVACINLAGIYDEFPMKKELEARLMNVQQARKNILDSLKIELNALSLSIKSQKDFVAIDEFQAKNKLYAMKQQAFEEDNAAVTDNYSSQIWKQLNQYIKDFGKENEYTFILGADGSGTMMYATEQKDITKEVSEYVNKRYHGEKK